MISFVKANSIDMMNQGNTFRGNGKAIACMNMDTLYSWANVFEKKLTRPETPLTIPRLAGFFFCQEIT